MQGNSPTVLAIPFVTGLLCGCTAIGTAKPKILARPWMSRVEETGVTTPHMDTCRCQKME